MLAVSALTLFGCSDAGGELDGEPDGGGEPMAGGPIPIKVVATVSPITSLAENIGGSRIELEGIVPEGTNSHTYEPAPSVAVVLSSADLFIANGLFLEEPTIELARSNKKAGGGDFKSWRQGDHRGRVGLRLLFPGVGRLSQPPPLDLPALGVEIRRIYPGRVGGVGPGERSLFRGELRQAKGAYRGLGTSASRRLWQPYPPKTASC